MKSFQWNENMFKTRVQWAAIERTMDFIFSIYEFVEYPSVMFHKIQLL